LCAMLTYVVQKLGEFQQKGHITNRHGSCSRLYGQDVMCQPPVRRCVEG
jgi:hypothetical protein